MRRPPATACPSASARLVIGIPSSRARSELRVVLRHRGRDDQLARTRDVLGVVALRDRDSERLEIPGPPWIGVASSYRHAAPSEELGERAHTSAGDPDEVDRARVGVGRQSHRPRRSEIRFMSAARLRALNEMKNVLRDIRGGRRPRALERLCAHARELRRIREHRLDRARQVIRW